METISIIVHVSILYTTGYYARVMSIRNLLMNFISLTSRDCQVINLGAGFDSTYWVLREIGLHPKMFVEVDFPAVTARKCQHVRLGVYVL